MEIGLLLRKSAMQSKKKLNRSAAKLLLAALLLAGAPLAHGAEVTAPTTATKLQTLKSSAENFVEYINYARVALAMKDYVIAKDTLVAAKDTLAQLKAAKALPKRGGVQSSRLTYNQGKAAHYFPIAAGPVSVKEVKAGPFWASSNDKGIAVTDAEMVYINLDLNNEKISANLDEAINDIDNKNYNSAQDRLSTISDEVVKEDTAVKTPLLRARDNLSLASSFFEYKNYDAARFALNHADKALDVAERDKTYASRKIRISELRQEISQLQAQIKANDPTALQKAGEKIKSWWNELKD